MEILNALPKEIQAEKTSVAIGKFDGIHRGHAAILSALCKEAADGAKTVVLAFDMGGKTILSKEDWEKRIASYDVDCLIDCPFSEEMKALSPDAFAKDILRDRLHCSLVVVGEDFRYGKERAGDTETLSVAGARYGFSVVVIPRVFEDGEAISSTWIRALIAAGELQKAALLLGYQLP